MNILLLGAGQVGATLAESLASEQNDITIVDTDASRLEQLRNKIDIRTVQGHASDPDILHDAGANDADLLIAVTCFDEVNMVACEVAYALFRVPLKIARIRNKKLSQELFFSPNSRTFAFHIDQVISPEAIVTDYIQGIIHMPEALQVVKFAESKAQMVAVRAVKDGPLVGHQISEIRDHMPKMDARIAAIFRGNDAVIPKGNTVIEENDEVFVLADNSAIRKVMSEMRALERPVNTVVLVGGGNIGEKLCFALKDKYRVKIIEYNLQRAQYLSEQPELSSSKVMVLHGSGTDRDLLIQENVANADVFCVVTENDQTNLFAAMLAKRLGVRRAIALINNASFVDIAENSGIDIAISPQQVTTSHVLRHIRRGDINTVYRLRKGAAEAIEARVHGTKKSSKLIGRTIEEIKLPADTSIVAIVREGEILIAHHDLEIKPEDHIIMFTANPKAIRKIESLFVVGLGFF